MGNNQIKPGGLPHLGQTMLEGHQKEGSQRHDLPGHEEEHRIGGNHDQNHGRNHHVQEKPVRTQGGRVGVSLQISRCVQGAEQSQQAHGQQKKSSEGIQVEGQVTTRHPPGQRPGLRRIGTQTRQSRQQSR